MGRALNIALLGTRGIPASYSGFETCVEQLGQRLVTRGHHVTVYCRSHHISYPGQTYKGMHLVKLPTIQNKYFDTIFHSFLSSIHALPKRYDIALYFIAGNSLVTWIPRLVGTKTIINVDGLDWKRDKWPRLAKKYIQFAEFMATKLPNVFITDSHVVQGYYQNTYNQLPPYIPYGSEVKKELPGDTLEKFGLEPRRYVLFVGRLVPENCAHHLIEAFREINTEMKCVIVGDAPYADDYIQSLRQCAGDDRRIIFTGYQFGKSYQELGSNSFIFVETSSVGGTHPALTEAMAFSNCIIVNNTPENLETIADGGLSYNGNQGAVSLRRVLEGLIQDPDQVEKYRLLAEARALNTYSWEKVTDEYEALFANLLE
ncbi:MAG: DUF1972 domain-containing protein [Anaerolineaceae bacterium]|nr:DUF1972 domain-containing protein [Anaerolineaceae bacterium]